MFIFSLILAWPRWPGVGPLLKGISPGMDVGDKAGAALRVVYALLADRTSESCFPPGSFFWWLLFYVSYMQ